LKKIPIPHGTRDQAELIAGPSLDNSNQMGNGHVPKRIHSIEGRPTKKEATIGPWSLEPNHCQSHASG